MNTELVKINASDYGLEESRAAEIEALFTPMLARMSELEGEYNDILKQEINPETCQRAKDLRMVYVKTRTGTAAIHKKAKEFYLNMGRFVDSWKNAQLLASGEKEKTLEAIEDHFENQERERIERIRIEREDLLRPYTDVFPMALGHMEQITFDNTLLGFKTAFEIRIAAEKKAEEDQIAFAKAEAERIENQRLENIRLQKEAAEREAQIVLERKIAKEIQDKRDNEFANEVKKVKADRDALEKKANKEQIARQNLEAEIQFKKAAKENQEQADLKAKQAAEKKAKLAPDKEKLLAFGQALNDVPRPGIKSIEAAAIMANINGLLVKLNNYIVENANKL